MRFLGFIGPTYNLDTVTVDCQRCINLYPELNEIGTGKEHEIASLKGTPGTTNVIEPGSGPIRGMHVATNGDLYVVSGNKLYYIYLSSGSWVADEKGTLNSSTGFCGMADNGTSLVIVDGVDGYVVTLATYAFAEITDPDFPGADQVTYQDGYFIFNHPSTGQFFWSDLNSATLYDALDFVTAEGAPDDVVGLISHHRDLWVFGDDSTEVYFNSGADPVFERVNGAFLEVGCAAKWSICRGNNAVFFLGKTKEGSLQIFTASGYQPQRISTHAVEQAISSYGDVSEAKAYVYADQGHFFYCINFPNADSTWVYDTTTNLWHERCYNNVGVLERHRADFHAYAYSYHLVGDYQNAGIYTLSSTVYSDNGAEIIRERVAPHISEGMKLMFYNSFQLDIFAGTGLDGVAQGTDPQVMMSFSNDGGQTWSSERSRSFGQIGQTKKRAKWERLGSARDRVFKIRISDPVKVTIQGAEIDVQQGRV